MLKVGTRRPASSQEMLESVERGLAGISLAQQPDWWAPWAQAHEGIARRARPVAELLVRRPADAATVQEAIRASGLPVDGLRYLPLTSSKTLDWIVLLDEELNLVGYASADGF